MGGFATKNNINKQGFQFLFQCKGRLRGIQPMTGTIQSGSVSLAKVPLNDQGVLVIVGRRPSEWQRTGRHHVHICTPWYAQFF